MVTPEVTKISPTYENLTKGQTLVDQRGERWLITGIKKEGVPARWAYTIKSKTADFTYTRPLGEIERYYKIEQPVIPKAGGFVAPTPKGSVEQALETGLKQAKKTGQNVYVFPTAEGMKLGKQPPPFGLQHYIAKPDGSYEYVKPAIPKAGKDLYWWNINELRQMCREGGLSDRGSKEDLVQRLKRAIK